MLRNGRRSLYSPQYVRGFATALREARTDLHEMSFHHQCELANLRRELDECRAALAELRAAVLARQHAKAELATLYRERALQRARAAERNPSLPLQ